MIHEPTLVTVDRLVSVTPGPPNNKCEKEIIRTQKIIVKLIMFNHDREKIWMIEP